MPNVIRTVEQKSAYSDVLDRLTVYNDAVSVSSNFQFCCLSNSDYNNVYYIS